MCLIGDGPVPCDIMLVGEAPGWREDEVHKPFAGKSGVLLDQMLRKVGMSRSEVFISNVNKCRPPENRTPSRTEQAACHPYLEKEFKYVKPKYVLLLGNSALQGVLKKSGITKHRGNWFELDGMKVMGSVHPAAVLRNPSYERLLLTDLGSFARGVRGQQAITPPPKTYLIRTARGLQGLVRAIFASEAVAYDLETNGFNPYLGDDSKVVTIAVSPRPGVSFVVPIEHPETPWKSPQRVLKLISTALAHTDAKRIAHNAKFDDKWLIRKTGLPVYADFDTMLAAHLLDENRLKGLKVLAPILLGVDAWADLDLNKGGATKESLSKLSRYNAKDADFTLRLYYLFRKELLQDSNLRTLRVFTRLIMPSSRCLTDVEMTGMWVDRERLTERLAQVHRKVRQLEGKLNRRAGEEINWNSTQQIARIFFGKLGMPIIQLTPKGAESTAESVLLHLAKDYKIAKLLLEYREWKKNDGTYLGNYAASIGHDNRLHTNFKLHGTVTGRLSSGKDEGSKDRGLNFQQVPRDTFIRGVFGSPPGWKFVEADFSQIELRIAAHYSADPTMMRHFLANDDIHMAMAMKLTGKPSERVTKEERKKAKSVNFGFLFGMGPKKFVDYAYDNYDLLVGFEEAKQYHTEFFESFRKLRPWHERQRRLVRLYKQVNSLIGRTRHLPDVDSEEEEVSREAERQAINSPVQSLASDLMLLALTILHERMPPDEAKIVGTVHDSLLFEVREDVVDVWVKDITETMEHLPLDDMFGVTLDVPVKVEVSVGTHWGEGEIV